MENKRTIKELSEMDGRVYVYLSNDEVGNLFLRNAKDEGIAYGDGASATSRKYAEIMAVNHDGTINFVGTNGRIAFGSGAKTIGDEKLLRIDYQKYVSGEKDYFYRKKY